MSVEHRVERCQSCGSSMEGVSERGGGDPHNPYCRECTTEEGALRPRDEVRNHMVSYWLRNQPVSREEAEQATDGYMAKMPAWQESAD